MRRYLSLFICLLVILGVTGCSSDNDVVDDNKVEEKEKINTKDDDLIKENVPTVVVGRLYGDINSKYNGGYLNSLRLNQDGTSLYNHCGKEAGCHELKGTYKIEENKLIVTSTMYWDYGEWPKLSEPEIDVFTINDNNTFSNDEEEYILVEE